jgi:hypothetical protein
MPAKSALAAKGNVLARSSMMGMLELWDVARQRTLATFQILPPEKPTEASSDWIVYTPEGYYEASPGAAKFIRWSANGQLFLAAPFEKMFHRPDLVEKALGGAPLPAVATTPARNALVIGAGEIQLEGKVRTISTVHKTFVLDVVSFTLPNGKTSKLAAPKPKTITVSAGTLLHWRDDVQHKPTLSDLKPGDLVAVIGKDAGTGGVLPAREVAVSKR